MRDQPCWTPHPSSDCVELRCGTLPTASVLRKFVHVTPWELREQSAWWVPWNFSVISFHFLSLSLRERNIPFSWSVSHSLSLCMETFVITNSHYIAPLKAVKKCRFFIDSLVSIPFQSSLAPIFQKLKTFMAGIYKLIDWAFDTSEYWNTIFLFFFFKVL